MTGLVWICAVLATGAPQKEDETAEPRSYDAGDLGLGEIEEPPVRDPAGSSGFGVGVNTTLLPAIGTIPGAGSATTINPGLSLRLWTGKLMIEPIVGFGFRSGDPLTFRLSAGALAGFALTEGNLRPMIGGGVLFGLSSAMDTTSAALLFGPMFALEYRLEALPQLALDAALFLPMQFDFDPFAFSIATSGGALVGFHYYFGG